MCSLFYTTHVTNDKLCCHLQYKIFSLMKKIRTIKFYFSKRSLCHRKGFDENYCLPEAHTFSSFRQNVSYFHWLVWLWWWDISHHYMITFEQRKISHGNLIANYIEKEICETVVNIHSSFHSAVNTFTAVTRKCDEIVSTSKLNCAKKNCGNTLWKWLFLWRDGYCKLNKGFSWGPRTKCTLA